MPDGRVDVRVPERPDQSSDLKSPDRVEELPGRFCELQGATSMKLLRRLGVCVGVLDDGDVPAAPSFPHRCRTGPSSSDESGL